MAYKKLTQKSNAVLNADLVRYIRKHCAEQNSTPIKEIARSLGVHYRTVEDVVYFKYWKWVK